MGDELDVGYNFGGNGTYNLIGPGSLNLNSTIIGYFGTGTFNQSGGTHTTQGLYLGENNGNGSNIGNGTYNLSGGTLSVSSVMGIGDLAAGSFTQTGGTNATGSLFLGDTVGVSGVYQMNGGNLSVSGDTRIGFSGTGAFIQSSGTSSLGTTYVGYYNASSRGALTMNGGTLNAKSLTVGYLSGSGTFTLNAGTTTVGTLTGTNGANSAFAFNGGVLTATNTTISNGLAFTVGNGSSAAVFNMGNGTHKFANGMIIAKNATAILNGANITGAVTVSNGGSLLFYSGNSHVADSAAVSINGGSIAASNGLINGAETLGTLTLSGNSMIDFGTGNNGNTYTFAGLSSFSGTLTVADWSGNAYKPGATTDPNTNAAQDRLVFATDPGFGKGTIISSISFYDDTGGFIGNGEEVSFNTEYEIVPAPEPTTIFGAVALVALVGWRERRLVKTLLSKRCGYEQIQ